VAAALKRISKVSAPFVDCGGYVGAVDIADGGWIIKIVFGVG
jgi:hypothetical protein